MKVSMNWLANYTLALRMNLIGVAMNRLAIVAITFVGMHAMDACAHRSALLHQFKLPRSPSLLEERLQWAIETQKRVPALARDGLHPILLLADRSLRAEINIY